MCRRWFRLAAAFAAVPSRIAAHALVFMFAAHLAPPAAAESGDPSFVASALWGGAEAVQMQGERAYVLHPNGLAIYDIAEPAQPVLLGRAELEGFMLYTCGSLVITDGLAFVARHDSGLRIIDVSDPARPHEIGEFHTSGCDYWDVAVADDYAYVTGGLANEFVIFDITDPSAPQMVGTLPLNGVPLRIAMKGIYALVTTDMLGLAVVNVSDPTAPWLAGFAYPTHGALWDIALSGSMAYCTWGSGEKGQDFDPSGITVFDVTCPTTPAVVGEWRSPDFARSVFAAGDLLYVGSGVGSFSILDVSDPRRPTGRGHLVTGGNAVDVVARAGVACVADNVGGFTTADVSDPSAPVVLGNAWEASSVTGATVTGSRAIVTDVLYGIHVLDVSEPAQPAFRGRLALPGSTRWVAVSGAHAFAACGDSGLRVVDLTDPGVLREVGSLATPVQHLAIAGAHACLVASRADFRTVDISNPTAPVIVGRCGLPTYPCAVAVEGSRAYVACQSDGLRIIDISDPAHPAVCGQHTHPGGIGNVVVRAGIAYLSIRSWGHLEIVDVSDPTHVRQLADIEVGPWTMGACLDGNELFVGTEGVTVVDVTDPTRPAVVGHRATHSGCRTIQVAGSCIYGSDGSALMVLGRDLSAVSPSPEPTHAIGLALENPVRGSAAVRLRLTDAGPVRLEVFDASGSRRASLWNGLAPAGESQWRLDARSLGLTTGTYFLRAWTEQGARTRAIVLLR